MTFPPGFCWEDGKAVQDGGRAVAFSPDGGWLVVGTRSGWLYRWDLRPKEPPRSGWAAHRGEVLQVVFGPDGNSCYSSSDDSTVARWDVSAHWREAARYRGKSPLFLAVRPDGSDVLCSTERLQDLDAVNLKSNRTSDVHFAHIAFSPRGALLAAQALHAIVLLDPLTFGVQRSMSDPQWQASADSAAQWLDIHPEGSLIAAGTFDRRLKLWETVSGKLMLDVLVGGDSEVRSVFSGDGRYLATPADQGTLLYELRGPDHLGMLAPQGRTLQAFAFSGDNQRLALVAGKVDDKDATLTLWNAPGTSCQRQWVCPVSRLAEPTVLSFHRADPLLAWSNGNDALRWCRLSGPSGPEAINRVSGKRFTFSPTEDKLWGIVNGNKLVGWKLPGFEVSVQWDNSVSQFLTGRSSIDCLAVSPHWAIAGCANGTIVLVDARTGTFRPLPSLGGQAVTAMAVSRDESLASVGLHDGTLAVVRIADGKVLNKFDDSRESIRTVAFSPAGDLLAAGLQNGSVRVLGKQGRDDFSRLISLDGHSGPVMLVQFAPDGNGLYVLVQGETALRLWKLGQLRSSLKQVGLSW